jgi:hypothetical protein
MTPKILEVKGQARELKWWVSKEAAQDPRSLAQSDYPPAGINLCQARNELSEALDDLEAERDGLRQVLARYRECFHEAERLSIREDSSAMCEHLDGSRWAIEELERQLGLPPAWKQSHPAIDEAKPVR